MPSLNERDLKAIKATFKGNKILLQYKGETSIDLLSKSEIKGIIDEFNSIRIKREYKEIPSGISIPDELMYRSNIVAGLKYFGFVYLITVNGNIYEVSAEKKNYSYLYINKLKIDDFKTILLQSFFTEDTWDNKYIKKINITLSNKPWL